MSIASESRLHERAVSWIIRGAYGYILALAFLLLQGIVTLAVIAYYSGYTWAQWVVIGLVIIIALAILIWLFVGLCDYGCLAVLLRIIGLIVFFGLGVAQWLFVAAILAAVVSTIIITIGLAMLTWDALTP